MNARRKIALVNVFFPPQAIGGATRVLADNIEVLAADYSDRFELVGFTSDFGRQVAYSIDVYAHRGFRVYRAGAPRRPHMDWIPRDQAMGDLFGEFLDFEKPDLVHFHCIQRLTGSVVEAARERGIPYVVTAHDAWWISDYQFLMDGKDIVYPEGHPDGTDPIHLPEGISLEESRERREFLKGLLAGASDVLAVSEAFAGLYRRNGVANVSVNRNGLRPQSWLPRTPSRSGRLRIAHVGGMSHHKGYHLFKEALGGGRFGNLEALVVDLSKPHGYERQDEWEGTPVTFVGKCPQDRIAELYARMDVLVAPSLWPESFGLVTREAASAGVWVVASDMGAIGEDVRVGIDGNVVPVHSSDALASVFAEMDMHPDRYRAPVPPVELADVSVQVAKLAELYARHDLDGMRLTQVATDTTAKGTPA